MSETESDGELGECCGLSSGGRKCAYYITNIIGGFCFIYGIIGLIKLDVIFLIIGSALIILAPLWNHNLSSFCKEMKNPVRLSSTIIFFILLGATITFAYISENEPLCIICGILLAVSGIWYFLSFFENGQKACIACLKSCCCSGDK